MRMHTLHSVASNWFAMPTATPLARNIKGHCTKMDLKTVRSDCKQKLAIFNLKVATTAVV